jgi:hypothetical protein
MTDLCVVSYPKDVSPWNLYFSAYYMYISKIFWHWLFTYFFTSHICLISSHKDIYFWPVFLENNFYIKILCYTVPAFCGRVMREKCGKTRNRNQPNALQCADTYKRSHVFYRRQFLHDILLYGSALFNFFICTYECFYMFGHWGRFLGRNWDKSLVGSYL